VIIRYVNLIRSSKCVLRICHYINCLCKYHQRISLNILFYVQWRFIYSKTVPIPPSSDCIYHGEAQTIGQVSDRITRHKSEHIAHKSEHIASILMKYIRFTDCGNVRPYLT